jgi:hypothetical protein
MRDDGSSRPPAIREAIQLHHAGKQHESRDCLRSFLLQQPGHIDALLWLAKVSPDPQEAVAAAELALKLDPANEVAQRAVIAVRKQAVEAPQQPAEQAELLATVALSTGMTLGQARAVNWSPRNINRPIGEALDEKIITLRDLAWAIEGAFDARIRDAARTILITHLVGAESKEPPPPLKVVTGSRYSERQERRSLLFYGFLAGVMLTLLLVLGIVDLAALVFSVTYRQQLFNQLCPPFLLILGIIWAMSEFSERFADQAVQYRSGRWGEERVIDQLRYLLDGQWTLYRNLEWPNRKWGDVDMALIGPGGAWSFEVKAYSGLIRNIGDRWEKKGRWWWRKLTKHPGQQARRNAARLKEYLKNQGADVGWVQAVVIWADEEGTLTVSDPATPIWTLEELPDHVEEIWQGRSLSEETVQKAVEVLDRTVKEVEEANKS